MDGRDPNQTDTKRDRKTSKMSNTNKQTNEHMNIKKHDDQQNHYFDVSHPEANETSSPAASIRSSPLDGLDDEEAAEAKAKWQPKYDQWAVEEAARKKEKEEYERQAKEEGFYTVDNPDPLDAWMPRYREPPESPTGLKEEKEATAEMGLSSGREGETDRTKTKAKETETDDEASAAARRVNQLLDLYQQPRDIFTRDDLLSAVRIKLARALVLREEVHGANDAIPTELQRSLCQVCSVAKEVDDAKYIAREMVRNILESKQRMESLFVVSEALGIWGIVQEEGEKASALRALRERIWKLDMEEEESSREKKDEEGT